jgi:two-component system nitrogen regulation sensor histidine kinase NtrY
MNIRNLFFRLKKNYNVNFLLCAAITVLSILIIITYYRINISAKIPDPSKIIGLILADLVVFLVLGLLLTHKFYQKSLSNSKKNLTKKLQNRIIVAFSIVAAIPTIIVAIFSTYFFIIGIQSWFDKKISNILDQSIIVAESYMTEHRARLKETALSVADDLNEIYYELIHNRNLFASTLNSEAELRALDEVIVFQKRTNTIIANTFLSFSLSIATIPQHLMDKADREGAVEILSDPTKMRVIIKLKEHEDVYLLVGRLVDSKIIDHIDKTNGAASEYYRLKEHISDMQIKFSIIFLCITLLVLLAAIIWGTILATRILKPIQELVIATKKVKDGDLTVQVPIKNLAQDEIKVLSLAFNHMIKQINHQQKELLIAQRALAWSDVARRVAHEIKNPLTPIHLASERLVRKFENEVVDKESFNKYIQMIIRHTNDIKTIVAEFVSFARLPAPIFVSCDLVSVVHDMVESKRLINDKIKYNFSSNEKAIDFAADVTQINQVMINILKNAEESISNIQNDPEINVYIKKLNNLITISVEDNGAGFPSNIIDKATEAYVTARSNGTGLGLAIVQKIIQDHCGSIIISNKNEGGARIELIFKLDELNSKLK